MLFQSASSPAAPVSFIFFVTLLITSTAGASYGRRYVPVVHNPPLPPNTAKFRSSAADLYGLFVASIRDNRIDVAGDVVGQAAEFLIRPFVAGDLGEANVSILNTDPSRVIEGMKNPYPADGEIMCYGIPDVTGQHMDTMAKMIATAKSKTAKDEFYITQLTAGRDALAIYRLTAQICCAHMMELKVDPAALTNLQILGAREKDIQDRGLAPILPW